MNTALQNPLNTYNNINKTNSHTNNNKYNNTQYPKKYKGFLIERAIGQFNTYYYTAENNKKRIHSHDSNEKSIYKICDCATELLHNKPVSYKYGLTIRNKAMTLIGLRTKFR